MKIRQFTTTLVYFDQHLGAVHSNKSSKSALCIFHMFSQDFDKNMKKLCKNMLLGFFPNAGRHISTGISP